MIELALLLQGSSLNADAMRMLTVSSVAMAVIVIVGFITFRLLRKSTDAGVKSQLDEEFERSKAALLLAAQSRKVEAEKAEVKSREADVETKERELLRENVDPARVFGQTDPLDGLELTEDQDLIIDPYSGQGYHLSSFLNDWPRSQARPKYVYRYPEGTVVKSSDLVREY
jgi:hypothetical protein